MKDMFILIADDEAGERFLIVQALKETGSFSRVEAVNNGRDLLAYLGNADVLPDVVLADINMPLVSGFEALCEVKSSPEFAPISFIIFSSAGNPAEIETARVLGADNYIVKPMDFEGYIKMARGLASFLENKK